MRRRKNAPISRRDKAALRRILKTHKGRGNRSNPKRYSRAKRKPKKGYDYKLRPYSSGSGRKYGTSGSRYAAKAYAASLRGMKVWSGGRTPRDRHHRRTAHRWSGKAQAAEGRAYKRVNPKRGKKSRRYQRGAAQGLGRKHLRKMTAHGRHLDRYGHRSTARSRRRTRR